MIRALSFAVLLFAWAAPAIAAPEPLVRIQPEYPDKALPSGLAGSVKTRLSVTAEGFVSAAEVLAESPEGLGFGDAALAAARRWTFRPGQPGVYTITMNFSGIEQAELPLAPEPIEKVTPLYPLRALGTYTNGLVRIIVRVAKDGTIKEQYLSLEAPRGMDFAKAAFDAVRGWRFAPGKPGLFVLVVKFIDDDAPAKGLDWYAMPVLPKPIHSVAPQYPVTAEGRATGRLKLFVTLAADGSVTEVAIADEAPKGQGFSAAAINAVSLWRFDKPKPGVYRLPLRIAAPQG